jgi:hypothetical protein
MSGNLKKSFFVLLVATCTGMAAAQTMAPALPPIPDGLVKPLTPRMESCEDIDCLVSTAQVMALDAARHLYEKDEAAGSPYSIVVGRQGDDIQITLLPGIGKRGAGITYVFDAAGSTLKRSFRNR